MLSLQAVSTQPPPTPVRCVNAQGFSLHAEVCCAAHQRKKLEHLCRYITRPAIANERLTRNRAGQIVLTLKTPYRDGTTVMSLRRAGAAAGGASAWSAQGVGALAADGESAQRVAA